MEDYYDLRVTKKEIFDLGEDAAKVNAIERIKKRASGIATGEVVLGTVKEGGMVGCGVVAGIGIANAWNPIGWGIAIGAGIAFGVWGGYDLYVAHQITVAGLEAEELYANPFKLVP